MSSLWCSITEYSRKLNISEMTVRRRIKSGKLVTKMSDGKYYIDMSKEFPVNDQQPYAFSAKKSDGNSQPSDKRVRKQSYLDQYNQQTERAYNLNHTNKDLTETRSVTEEPRQVHWLELQKRILNVNQTTLDKLMQFEQDLIEKYTDKISSLQDEIKQLSLRLQAKDHELDLLKQKQEDLEVLVKILDPSSKEQT